MAKIVKIVALDVLNKILKKVYNKTKKYTDDQISIELRGVIPLIKTNSENIEKLKNTTKESINGLQSRLGNAENNIEKLQNTTSTQQESINRLQSRLETAESNVAVLQGKVYDYLGNDEIDTVFEEAEKEA